MKKFILFFFLITSLMIYCVDMWVADAGPLSAFVHVLIPKGASSRQVAEKLDQANVINKPWLFVLVARLSGMDKKLQTGEYEFLPHVSMLDAMRKIATGDVFYWKMTFREGLTVAQMLEIIENNEMLTGDLTIKPAEGTMLPETYNYMIGDSKNSVVEQAQKAMDKLLNEVWTIRQEKLPVKTPYELLILASIIEKETGLAEERGKVASVFVNRLRKVMRLQTDPTVIYAITKGQFELGRALSRKDLEMDSPYNTYQNYGLPPAPICNPGKDSLKAAANPENTDLLYFVASGNGGHNFAKSLNEHNQNVSKWKNRAKAGLF